MGGLAVALRPGVRGDIDQLERMLAAAPHRGEETERVALGGCVAGVVRRPGRGDATVATDGRLLTAFAGVLDNATELRAALPRHDETDTAAGVVLAAFREFGPETVNRLRGAFAAVVSDGRQLWCFRDHLGLRSLFYRHDRSGVLAASEAKQVVAGTGRPRRPDRAAVEAIFFDRYDDDTASPLQGVQRLPKATVLHGSPLAVRRSRYWEPESLLETAQAAADDLADAFHKLFSQAVHRTLTGNDGVSLSGGIDSPAIAAYAADEHLRRWGRPLAAVSAVYPDQPAVDEREYIDLVATELGLPLHTYVPSAPHLDQLEHWVRLLDGPAPRWATTEADEHYAIAGSLGLRTLLSGEVAEFVFDMRRYLLAHLLLTGRLDAFVDRVRQYRAAGTTTIRVARAVIPALLPRRLAVLHARLRAPARDKVPDWIDSRETHVVPSGVELPARRRWRAQQLTAFDGPGLGIEADEIRQEYRGVTVRRPWADVDLWEWFLSLPADQKFPDLQRKGLVRAFLRGHVPDEILDRRRGTVFNDWIMAGVDYGELRRWTIDTDVRIRGVRYDRLSDLLDRRALSLRDYIWAKDLAVAHAFLVVT